MSKKKEKKLNIFASYFNSLKKRWIFAVFCQGNKKRPTSTSFTCKNTDPKRLPIFVKVWFYAKNDLPKTPL